MKAVNLSRLLLLTILFPSVYVVAVILASYLPHRTGLLTHEGEHLALALAIVAGIIPFSFFVHRIFQRIQHHIVKQNEELGRRAWEMEVLLKVGRAVEESLDMNQVLPASLKEVLKATSAEYAEVWVLAPREGALFLRYQEGKAQEAFRELTRFRLGEGYPGLVAQSGRSILVHNLPQDPRFLRGRVKAEGFHSFYALPLRHTGGMVGVLAVAARDPKALTRESELHLLELMAEHIAAAMENARLHEEVRTLAVLGERERLAREMHDGLAQVLGYVNTKAQAVKELLRTGQVEAALGQMEQLEEAAQETYEDVREAILALGVDGWKRPLLETLKAYVDRSVELSGVPTELVVEGKPTPFNPSIEVQLLRIVQEALSNVRKHAQATRSRVVLTFGPDRTRLMVEDNGRGFDPNHPTQGPWPHLGLQSMRERASAIGAQFTLETAQGKGTRVILDLPGRGL